MNYTNYNMNYTNYMNYNMNFVYIGFPTLPPPSLRPLRGLCDSVLRCFPRSPLHRSVRCANSAIPSSAAPIKKIIKHSKSHYYLLVINATTPTESYYPHRVLLPPFERRSSGGRNRGVRAADGAMEGGACVITRKGVATNTI